jgi:hypothetical protein
MSEIRPWLNPILWMVALVLINVLWSNVSQQEAPNEINKFGQFESVRQLEVASVFGSQDAIPAVLTSEFSSTALDQGNVSFSIRLNNDSVVYAWSGLLSDDVPAWSADLAPGTYTILTEMEDGIEVQQTLTLKPFATIQTEGHVLLSAMLVVVAVAENIARGWLASRRPAESKGAPTNAPFKTTPLGSESDMAWSENDSPWRDPLR